MRSLLSTHSLSQDEIRTIFSYARAFSEFVFQGQSIPLLRGKTWVTLFFENSTRTRVSFDIAVRKLEGACVNFTASSSSVQKGESLADTALNLQAMGPNGVILRHPCS